MLKLVHALDMDFDNVINYYNSFEDKWKDLNCYAITRVTKGLQSYFEYINIYERNLYYLIM